MTYVHNWYKDYIIDYLPSLSQACVGDGETFDKDDYMGAIRVKCMRVLDLCQIG